MANRSTALGELYRRDRHAARALILEELTETQGVVVSAALRLGIKRRQLLRYLWRENLWTELDRIREEVDARRVAERKELESWMKK